MTYVTQYSKQEKLWTVGTWTPSAHGDPTWNPEMDFDSREKAHEFINYLNGGKGNPFDWGE